MAKVTITPVTINTGYQITPDLVAYTACDASLKNQCVHTGREILLFKNTGAVARVITVSSIADEEGRTGDLTQSIAAGEEYVTQMFPTMGWRQADGYLYFEAAHAEVTVLVLRVP